MNRITISVITVAVAASSAFSWAIEHRAKIRLEEQDETRRHQAEQLAQLAGKNEQLSNLVGQVEGWQSLSKDQLRELLVLRNEAGRLRRSITEMAKIQAANAQLQAMVSKSEKQLAEAQTAPNYWPKDQLSFAGFADPTSAMKSTLAAMKSGDVRSWLDSCTPETKTSLENEMTREGLSEAQQAREFKAVSDGLLSSSCGFHIVDQTMPSSDEAIIHLSFDGEGKTRTFVLKRMGNAWKCDNMIDLVQ